MNISLGPKQKLTSYRKIAIASWKHPRDPSTYAMLDLPVDAALAFLGARPSETPLTLTHYVTKIAAHGSHLLRRFQKVFANPAAYKGLFESDHP